MLGTAYAFRQYMTVMATLPLQKSINALFVANLLNSRRRGMQIHEEFDRCPVCLDPYRTVNILKYDPDKFLYRIEWNYACGSLAKAEASLNNRIYEYHLVTDCPDASKVVLTLRKELAGTVKPKRKD
jgi:hypothetical protein